MIIYREVTNCQCHICKKSLIGIIGKDVGIIMITKKANNIVYNICTYLCTKCGYIIQSSIEQIKNEQ